MLEKTLESPLDCKETLPVHSKGDQSWVFIGRTDVEAETPILWPPHANSWLIGKDSDAGRDWGQEEKGTTEGEMAGWHHQLDGHEFEWTLGVGDGQGGLACCLSWGRKESDTTELLNWTELNWLMVFTVRFFRCGFLNVEVVSFYSLSRFFFLINERVLNFVKCFFCINWDDHVLFPLILLMWLLGLIFICWTTLYSKNKFHLVMVWSFQFRLQAFVEEFYINVFPPLQFLGKVWELILVL